MHAKYEVSISYGSKVIVKVKVDNRQTNKQTGQKQYTPDHSIQGHVRNKSFNEFSSSILLHKMPKLYLWHHSRTATFQPIKIHVYLPFLCHKLNYEIALVHSVNRTRQSMFVKHVPLLWAYFIEATQLLGKHFKSLISCKIWWNLMSYFPICTP